MGRLCPFRESRWKTTDTQMEGIWNNSIKGRQQGSFLGLPSGPRSSRHFALIPSSIDSIGLAEKMKQTRPVTVIVIVVPAILFTCLAPWPFPPFHPINIQSLDALVAHPQLTPSSVPSRAPFHPLVVPSVHLLSTDVGRWRWRRSECLTLLMGALNAVCTTHANGVI
ncbi:hypothetical protein CMEL01_02155 [Colletotrichum melonis]|uniref:Uncharacterized protein n=1 Tax=Colletotrichum melonis TaxID=1209925 RepID=A0AAI9UIV4_9PEZI|nr:hypothetical protein CMEL01_02155 [Colletotrichum melonis]